MAKKTRAVSKASKKVSKTSPKVSKAASKKVSVKITKKARVLIPKLDKPKPLSKKFLGSSVVQDLLVELAGEKALKVIGELTEPMTDDALAESSKMKVSEVRAVMNKLHSARVATYLRTRSDDGWYTYTWSVQEDRIKEAIEARKPQDEEKKAGSSEYYSCPNCAPTTKKKLSFDTAVETGFRCPECSEMLEFVE